MTIFNHLIHTAINGQAIMIAEGNYITEFIITRLSVNNKVVQTNKLDHFTISEQSHLYRSEQDFCTFSFKNCFKNISQESKAQPTRQKNQYINLGTTFFL